MPQLSSISVNVNNISNADNLQASCCWPCTCLWLIVREGHRQIALDLGPKVLMVHLGSAVAPLSRHTWHETCQMLEAEAVT